MVVEPCGIGSGAIVERLARGVTRDVRVNLVGAMVVCIEFVRVRMDERSSERSQRDGHRQPHRSQRPDHAVIVRETHGTVKLKGIWALG